MTNEVQPAPPAQPGDSPGGPGGMPRWVIGALLGGGVVIIGLLVVVILLLAGGDDSSGDQAKDPGKTASAKAETFVVSGDITLVDSGVRWDTVGGACYGTEGYDDMHGGTQVVVKDAAGTTIAVGQLKDGAKENSVTCRFGFVVDEVPSGSAAYSLEVSHRGSFSFTEDAANTIHLSLG